MAMKKINCLIADDEALAREVIKNHIDKLEALTVVGNCANGVEVYAFLKEQQVDLLFLDIQMPHLTGIGLLKTLDHLPGIILTTAYREFALESYDLNVIDYLVKPVSFERFLKAVDKYVRRVGNVNLPAISEQPPLQKPNDLDFIYIKSNGRLVRVLIKDIVYLEGLKEFVMVYTPKGSFKTYRTLTYFSEKLSDQLFIRVHRSYIVSITHITSYTTTLIEVAKVNIPIGKSYAINVSRKLVIL